MVNFKVDIKRDYSTHGVESLQMDSGRGNMGQEWSGVRWFQLKFKGRT